VPISELAPPITGSPHTLHLPHMVVDLCSAGGLTDCQAIWLAEHWPDLPDDWASHPLLRSTREHTRAYIDHHRRLEAQTDPKAKELIPHAS
jgi:hypothetical protein